jgi:D-glycero-D-manno-heptose 1,7-bisphosphate phosphatase
MRPAVFLDRDGTLIEDRGYAHRLEDYAPIAGAHQAARLLRDAGFALVVISNQSGVGRGIFSPAELARFEAHLLADFAAHGAPLDAIYACPHAPEAGCDCRKPRTGLLERARREHDLDLEKSWVIGDKRIDVELARRAGCRAAHVQSGLEQLDPDEPGVLHARDLLAAVHAILAG